MLKIFTSQFVLIFCAAIFGYYYGEITNAVKFALFENFDNEKADLPKTATVIKNEQNKIANMYTRTELAKFNGIDDPSLYLALLGSVYNVTKGIQHYGQGCAYNFFVGRDASVSFVTGEFDNYEPEKADDVLQLGLQDLLNLINWKEFYDKMYECKGKLIGRFYDEQGAPTKYHNKFLAMVHTAKEINTKDKELRTTYPDCNIEWSEKLGTRVWCTKSSGGKERDWTGYPRKIYELGGDKFRCACINVADLETTKVMLKPYDNCERLAEECYYRV